MHEPETALGRARLLLLLRAARDAGISPLPVRHLHLMAYLANVLAPVWDMPPLEGKLLKRRGGPFYPRLQADLDRLVGASLVSVTGLRHVVEDGQWRLDGEYDLVEPRVREAIQFAIANPHWSKEAQFLRELAFAVAGLTNDELNNASREDATYADGMVAIGRVIDFAEWRSSPYSSNAARELGSLVPGSTDSEKLHLYVQHLQRRLHGAR